MNYEETFNVFGEKFIKLNYENGSFAIIPTDEANSDYQRYLRWLEKPDADEAQSL